MFVQWTITALAVVSAVDGLALPTICPEYANHYCACEITDQAKATPLRMCSYEIQEGIACKPCLNSRQDQANCSSCPGNTCPVCAADELELLSWQRSMTPKAFKDLKNIGYITGSYTFVIPQNTDGTNSSDDEYTSNDYSVFKDFFNRQMTTEGQNHITEGRFYELSNFITNYTVSENWRSLGNAGNEKEEILAKDKAGNLTSEIKDDFEIFDKYIPKSAQQQQKKEWRTENEEISENASEDVKSGNGNESFETRVDKKSLLNNKMFGVVEAEEISMSAPDDGKSQNGNKTFEVKVEVNLIFNDKQLGMTEKEETSLSMSTSEKNKSEGGEFETSVNRKLLVTSISELSSEMDEENPLLGNKQWEMIENEDMSESSSEYLKSWNGNMSFETTVQGKSLLNNNKLEMIANEEISKSASEETKLKYSNQNFLYQTSSYYDEPITAESHTGRSSGNGYKAAFMHDIAPSLDDKPDSNGRQLEKLLINATNSENESSTKMNWLRFGMTREYKLKDLDINASYRYARASNDEHRNSWCTTDDKKYLYGNLKCKLWTYKKECEVKCSQNYHYAGQDRKSFSCFRKKNVWEPEIVPCEKVPKEMVVKEVKATEDNISKTIKSPKGSITDNIVKTSTHFDDEFDPNEEFDPEEEYDPLNNGPDLLASYRDDNLFGSMYEEYE